jgi:Ca-activated chloride channel family protein
MVRCLLFVVVPIFICSLMYGCAAKTSGYFDPAEAMRTGSPAATYDKTRTVISPLSAAQDQMQAALIPGQTTPSREEELWVIAKSEGHVQQNGDHGFDMSRTRGNGVSQPAVASEDDLPGTGSLLARLPDQPQGQPVPVPLKHTDVTADIAGYIATVAVTQQYHNPFSSKIEAIYVFPLPHNAAVNEFVMTIGDRHIRGIIRERAEAQRIYDSAKAQGYVASLLTQDRPNIFMQSVANIEPGKEIDIAITYFHTLEYSDGWYEWHFPMVVGPRFNPPGSTEGVGAVPRLAAGASGQKTEVQYLKPTERSGHDISLSVHLDAGVKVEQVEVPSHRTNLRTEGNLAEVSLQKSDSIPNKDFVLRYRVAGDKLKSAIVASRDKTGGYFSVMLYPPQSLNHLPRKPLELVYVLDCSGSMDGEPIAQAKAAIRCSLTRMRADDTFQIIKFANDAAMMSDKPLAATPANVRRALAYLDESYGGGGTMMMEGIRKALDAPRDESRLRFVCFLTDGFIGNEAEILGEIHQRIGSSRIFSFGVGSSVNRYLLDHMAKMGRGACAYLALNQKAEPVMEAFFERISHPALTDISIDWGGMKVSDVFPDAVPDLFVGRPVILTGKFSGNGVANIRVKGKVGNESQVIPLALDLERAGGPKGSLRPIWARAKIAALADRATWEANSGLGGQIKSLALEYGLMSHFTAFIAVDSTQKTEGNYGTSVAVPVPVPEGVRYDTTVEKAKSESRIDER